MQYIDVTEAEAVDPATGLARPGYEIWSYSWKRVIPDTPEEIAARHVWPNKSKDASIAMKAFPGWATWTAAEAEAWITTNVTDLNGAKTALKAMAKAIVLLRDHSQITR